MVLCAVPTFLAPAFPARDSLPESRGKSTHFPEKQPKWLKKQTKKRPPHRDVPPGSWTIKH